ncbi:Transmembrane domain-containing protein [Spironucleus salmonicida]|uniref:Transmembrane domain-containing protein n=1 Tax=Spironucleus salmonicida TaxID=348837 RepID=A0A9P8S266_9EUKA|nr:Transmembrane domain-containing protein [Spironucleus salmonicida]
MLYQIKRLHNIVLICQCFRNNQYQLLHICRQILIFQLLTIVLSLQKQKQQQYNLKSNLINIPNQVVRYTYCRVLNAVLKKQLDLNLIINKQIKHNLYQIKYQITYFHPTYCLCFANVFTLVLSILIIKFNIISSITFIYLSIHLIFPIRSLLIESQFTMFYLKSSNFIVSYTYLLFTLLDLIIVLLNGLQIFLALKVTTGIVNYLCSYTLKLLLLLISSNSSDISKFYEKQIDVILRINYLQLIVLFIIIYHKLFLLSYYINLYIIQFYNNDLIIKQIK